ncbi:MAG TPA: hypothetical protein VI588_00470 [Candidatus Gracilibacteria bacterium]|nr:hypothetical protein [Candidatus Gracilibacteria bacterium]
MADDTAKQQGSPLKPENGDKNQDVQHAAPEPKKNGLVQQKVVQGEVQQLVKNTEGQPIQAGVLDEQAKKKRRRRRRKKRSPEATPNLKNEAGRTQSQPKEQTLPQEQAPQKEEAHPQEAAKVPDIQKTEPSHFRRKEEHPRVIRGEPVLPKRSLMPEPPKEPELPPPVVELEEFQDEEAQPDEVTTESPYGTAPQGPYWPKQPEEEQAQVQEPEQEQEPEAEPEPEPEQLPELEPEPQQEEEQEVRIGPKEEQAPPVPVGRLREDIPYKRSEGRVQEQPEEAEDVIPPEIKEAAPKKAGLKELIEEHHQKEEAEKKTEIPDAKLDEKKQPRSTDILKSLLDALERAWPVVTRVINLRIIGMFLLVIALGWGIFFVYTQGYIQKLIGLIPSAPQKPANFVALNDQELREYGFAGTFLFAGNEGSIYDRIPEEIVVASFFGELREPKIQGETGITAATFFGSLMDEAQDMNQFVEYVRNLDELRNLYKVDVYALLDQTTDRGAKLLEYMDQLDAARERSLEYQSSININIDDLQVSYNSLTPDKQKFEKDFFDSLTELQAEKSDVLLKNFIDVSQKQVALRSRLAALQKLVAYYETALERLEIRIEAVEKNTAALIEGIRVVDVPGADLDIIIENQ